MAVKRDVAHEGKIKKIENEKGYSICGARNRQGEPCKHRAGFGTNHLGSGRCKFHGGSSTGPKNKKNHDGNKNNEKHGLYSKYLPSETEELMDMIEEQDTLDILWEQIKLQFAIIIRSQKIMHVKDRGDYDIKSISTSIIGDTESVKEDFITAGERQTALLQAQSRAMTTLSGLIKDYEGLLDKETATAIQKARLDNIRAKTDNIKGVADEVEGLGNLFKKIYGGNNDKG